ncbi:MAG: ABC transporter substrate-binding protein [Thermoplasmatales archaeon]
MMKKKSSRTLLLIMVFVATFAMATSGLYIAIQNGNSDVYENSATSTSAVTSTTTSPAGNITIVQSVNPTFLDSFSPFNPSAYPYELLSFFYEPLYQVDPLNGTSIPWLATGLNWSNNYHTLTFNLRKDVHYSNGALFNSTDVNITFQLEKEYPALDIYGVWSYLSNVTANGAYQIVFNFTSVGITELYYIETTLIIYAPQFEKVSNPVTFTDPNPIGTGPYILSHFSATKIVLTASSHYWQPNEPHIKNVIVNAYTSNTVADEALEAGDIDWAELFAPNMSKIYTAINPEYYHYYFPLSEPIILYLNDLRWPLNESYFRQALSIAINRTQIYLDGEYGYEPPASLNMIQAQISTWVNSSLQQEAGELSTFNTTKALNLLEAHGYYLKSGSLYAPNGTKVPSMTIQTVSGYTDWDADISFIATDLQSLGISITAETPIYSTVMSNLYTGNYWMLQEGDSGSGPLPYYIYSATYSDNGHVTPLGKTASTDWERWNTTNGFAANLSAFASTTNKAIEYNASNNMTSVLLNQMPVIPLVFGANWYEYNNQTIGGFPTSSNFYWFPLGLSSEVVILHLYSKVISVPSKSILSTINIYILTGVIIAAVVIGLVIYIRVNMKKGRRGVPKQPKKE